MFIRNKYFLQFIFLLFLQNISAQDTLYVYQEVVVYDTIYLQAKVKSVMISANGVDDYFKEREKVIEKERLKKLVDEVIDSFLEKKEIEKKHLKNAFKPDHPFSFQIKSNALFVDNEFWSSDSAFQNIFLGLGIDLSYIFSKNWSITFAPMFYYGINKSPTTDPNNSNFEGYYFAENKPYLFNDLNFSKSLWLFPLSIGYQYKKFKPSVGLFYQPLFYEVSFLTANDEEVQQFIKNETFKEVFHQFGLVFGLDYKIFIGVDIQAQYLLSMPQYFALKSSSPSFIYPEKTQIQMFSFGVKVRL